MALQDVTPQLRTRLRKVEWIVVLFLGGAFLLVLVSIGWWIKKTGDSRGWFVTEVPYYTYLESGSGVKAGAPVKMLGFTIGKVAEVEAQEDSQWARENHFNVFVRLLVREPYYGFIHTDSGIRLSGAGIDLLGGSWLEISRAEGAGIPTVIVTNLEPRLLSDKYAFPPDGQTNKYRIYLPFTRADHGFYLKTDRAESLVDNASAILETLRSALPGLTNQIGTALAQLNQLAGEMRAAAGRPGGVGDLLLPTNLNQRLDQTLADVHSLSDRLGPVLEKTGQTLDTVQDNSKRLGPLLDNVRGTVTNLESMVVSLKGQVENTNLLGNVSRLADKAALLADTTDTLMRRHWLFRSAFRTNRAEKPKPQAVSR